jgi:hypothetical protein
MDSSKTLLWNTFLNECLQITEKETGHTHQWDNIYPTNKQREDILDGLFMKRASLGAIILRNRSLNKK